MHFLYPYNRDTIINKIIHVLYIDLIWPSKCLTWHERVKATSCDKFWGKSKLNRLTLTNTVHEPNNLMLKNDPLISPTVSIFTSRSCSPIDNLWEKDHRKFCNVVVKTKVTCGQGRSLISCLAFIWKSYLIMEHLPWHLTDL